MIEASGLPIHIDPVVPHATAFCRSIWRLYLNPLSPYEEFQRFFAIEFEAANNEAVRRFEVLRDQLSKLIGKQLRDQSKSDLADAVESGEITLDRLDRAKNNLIVDLNDFDFPLAAFEFLREFSADRTKSFSDLLTLLETKINKTTHEPSSGKRTAAQAFTYFSSVFASTLKSFRTRTADLRPDLVGSIRDVSTEYLEWVKGHSDVLDQVAWEAFERIIAEIFASRGFHIDLTARVRNKSADLLAFRTDDVGVTHRYLIECKRFNRSRSVGLDIVNAVLGASRRANADHAFLVTSSRFTQDVLLMRDSLRELRLHLRDGDDVTKWLSEYNSCDGGLWIAPNLELPDARMVGDSVIAHNPGSRADGNRKKRGSRALTF